MAQSHIHIIAEESQDSTPESLQRVDLRSAIADILYASGDLKARDLLLHCAESGRGWVGTCLACGYEHYHAQSCSLRICPNCAGRRAAILADDLAPMVARAVRQVDFPFPLKHLVFTTDICLLDYINYDAGAKTVDVVTLALLGRKISHLQTKIRELIQDHFAAELQIGGAISAEFGPGGYMLHFHVLAVVPFVDQKALGDAWRAFTNKPYNDPYVEAIKGPLQEQLARVSYVCKEVAAGIGSKEGRNADTTNTDRIAAFVAEHTAAPLIAGIHFALKGHRRFRTFGLLYGHADDEEQTKACPVCGGFMWWRSELEWAAANADRDVLSLKRANKLPDARGDPTSDLRQLGLFDG